MQKISKKMMIIIGAVLAVIILLVTVLITAGGSNNKKLNEQLDLGAKYLTELDYEQAIVAFKAAIEIEPKCVEAYLALAEAYIAIENYESAIQVLNIGLEETKDESIGKVLKETEAVQEQIVFQVQMGKCLERGTEYFYKKDYTNAIKEYKTLLEYDVNSVEAYLRIIEVYMALEDYDLALKYAEEGYKQTGDDVLYQMIGEIESCIKEKEMLKLPEYLEFGQIEIDNQLYTFSSYYKTDYIVVENDFEDVIKNVIEAGMLADVDALTTMIKGILQEVVSKNIANESTTKDVENIEFWTEVDGAVFKYEYLKSQFFETRIVVEYRQEEGTMFRCSCNGDDISYLQGEVQGYLINGEFSCVEYDITSLLSGDIVDKIWKWGSAKDELVEGEYIKKFKLWNDSEYSLSHSYYENGFLQYAWTAPDGTKFTDKITHLDGSEYYYDQRRTGDITGVLYLCGF